jgi:hypothetical protein
MVAIVIIFGIVVFFAALRRCVDLEDFPLPAIFAVSFFPPSSSPYLSSRHI